MVLTHPQQIAEALAQDQGGQWLPQALRARRKNLRKARVSVEQQMEHLTEAYLAKVLDLDEYKRRQQELEQRLQAIAGQVRHLEVDVQRHDELSAMVESIEVFCQRVAQGLTDATFEQKRQVIELLIDRVVITGNEVEIRYVIPTSKSSEHIRFYHLRLDHFDRPVVANHFQQAQGTGLFQGQAGDPIDIFLRAFQWVFDPSAKAKNLPNPIPVAGEKATLVRSRPQSCDR